MDSAAFCTAKVISLKDGNASDGVKRGGGRKERKFARCMRTYEMYLRGMPNNVGPSTFIEVGRGRDWDMALLSRRLDIVPLRFERWYMAKMVPWRGWSNVRGFGGQ